MEFKNGEEIFKQIYNNDNSQNINDVYSGIKKFYSQECYLKDLLPEKNIIINRDSRLVEGAFLEKKFRRALNFNLKR